MNEMIERVAKALEKFQLDDGSPCCLYSADIRREIARAVIAAMREPTEAMNKTGLDEFAGYDRRFDVEDKAVNKIWQAMIEGALKDR